VSSDGDEKLFRKMLERYLAGEFELSGVVVLVNEEEQRIEMLTLNASSSQAFILMLHGLQTLHDKALSTTKFNETVH
jgi:hypothetical protein